MKFLFTSLALFMLIISSVSVLAYQDNTDQKVSYSKRTFSEQEFEELKSKVGVAREGVNYNVKINGYGTGLIPPTEEQWEKMKARAVFVDKMTFRDASSPVSHDNSATVWFPPIGHQAAEGSCVAWATGYYNKTFQEAREHNWDLSGCTWDNGYEGYPSPAYQDKIFSPDFIYHQINGGTDNGSTYGDALNLLYRIGCSTWDNMPYDMNNSTDWPSESAWRQAPVYRSATPYSYADVTDDTDINNLKQFLAGYNNAIISINANYYSELTSDDLWTSDTYNASSTNHANLIVGYDDNFGPYTEGGTTKYGAFKVVNSWGIGSWENVNDGFYWISYECMKQNIGSYMFYENLVGYEPEMISIFSMDHDLRGECQVSVGMGSSSSPSVTKRFDDYVYNGGNHAYPANVMVMDITEFGTPADAENLFIQVLDGGSTVLGQINSFSIETYDDYASGTPAATYISTEAPVNTSESIDVFAQLQFTDDSTPPASISDLQVANTSSYSATLSWTASGDDGNTGTAAAYEICYAQSIIDQTNFDAATQVVSPPDPSAAGTTESFTVEGLNNSTSYYFAIKVIDDSANESGVSNSPSGTTLGAPQIAVSPASLNDNLQAGASTTQSFTISNTGDGLLEFTIPDFELTSSDEVLAVSNITNEKNIGFYADESRVGTSEPLPKKMTGTPTGNTGVYELLGESGDVVETYQNFPIEVGGIEWVDGDIFGVGISSDIYIYNPETELYSTAFTVDIGTPYQCAWDGEYLWIGNNSGNIYGYDLTGNLIGSFSTPCSGYVTMTFDGENFLVSQIFQSNPTIYKLDYQGNVLGTYNINNYAGDIYALAWVSQHADGQLWALGELSGNSQISQLSFNGNEFNYVNGFIFNDTDEAYSIAHDGCDMLFSDWDGPLFKLDDGINEGSWLTLSDITGSVAAGAPLTVEATIDAAELYDGDYETVVRVNSNDPVTPTAELPVSIQVTGIPDISLPASAIDFGDVYQDVQATWYLQINNTGTKELTITSIGADNTIFTTDIDTASINPGDSLQLEVYVTTSSTGTHTGTMTITSDDPDTPSSTVALTANCVASPVMAISPDSIEVTLETGQTTTETLSISNTGESELTFSFPDYLNTNQVTILQDQTAVSSYPYTELARGESDPRIGQEINSASGGSDTFGYNWIDSNSPNGPSFDWIDISQTGNLVSELSLDSYVGGFPIGFSFPFYENIYSQFYISSPGYIMFSNPGYNFNNQTIPLGDDPNNFIAWCWDDLYPRGTVHYQTVNNQLIIQFTEYGEYGNSSTSITAQVILSPSGKIKIQYLNTTGGFDTDGCTVGIENAAGDDGLQVAFNAAYIEDNLALEFSSVAEWISVTPATGTLAPGATTNIEVGIDAAGMTYGRRIARLNINSNDPSKLSYDYQVAVNIPASQELIDDSLALVALYNAANGDNWNNNTGWLTDPLYNWYGVSISNGQITKLELPDNNLSGYIPNEIGGLSNLTVLNLRHNWGLNGTSIPDSIVNLENLTELNLLNNGHSGSIPESIGNLSGLEYLDLSENWNLTGSIPASIGNMTSLSYLNLGYSNLTGSIPAEIGNLVSLQDLYLYGNQLSGSIPAEIGNIVSLYSINVSNNQLTGNIPAEFGNCSNLRYLRLYNNQLSGSIPPEIGNASNLCYIELQNNQLTGTIPAELGNLNIYRLYLDNNQLEGEIPASFENVNFGYLHLHNNNLSGDLPASLAEMVNNPLSLPEEEKVAYESQPMYLRDGSLASSAQKDAALNVNYRLKVENNKFTFANLETSGITPGSIGTFTYAPQDTVFGLEYIDATNALTVLDGKAADNTYQWYYNIDALTGEINDTLISIEATGGYRCVVSNTVYPDLELMSEVHGSIENPQLEADSLALVALYNATEGANWNNNENWLTGPIDTWYGVTLSNWRVGKLELPGNNLNGYIPNEIGELTNLTVLNLRYNWGLNGTSIPDSIVNIENLTELNLQNNGHSGSIPESIGNLSALEYLNLSENWNLTGSIPASIGNMNSLSYLNLSYNNFTGSIPSEIGNLVNLQNLYLSNNQLTGSIPAEIWNLVSLCRFILSDNQLTGDIPAEIGNLVNTDVLMLSNNQLSGSIPPEIVNVSNITFLGLENNQLTGTIPAEMGNMNIWGLYLGNNLLVGEIPASFENVNFGELHLHNNNLSGDLPASLAEMVNNPLSLPEEEKVAYKSQPMYLRDGSLASSVKKDVALNVSYVLWVENNKFTFANLESSGVLPGSIEDFSYAPQDTTLAITTDGETITAIDGNHADNYFTWYHDGTQLSDTTRIIASQGEGEYWFSVTNPVYPGLTLHSDTLTIEASDVPVNLDVPTATINAGDDECFNAQNDITVAGDGSVEVADGATATFIAGHSIRFLPGFHAQAGSYVDAHITTDGSFCDNLPAAPIMAAEPVDDKSVEPEKPEAEEKLFENQSMKVYPNPNNGRFTIKLENIESETRVMMYSAIGQKVYDVTMTEQLHSVELPDVQRGIYFIKAINNQKQLDQKIVIQ